jgi:hypothetical protein
LYDVDGDLDKNSRSSDPMEGTILARSRMVNESTRPGEGRSRKKKETIPGTLTERDCRKPPG